MPNNLLFSFKRKNWHLSNSCKTFWITNKSDFDGGLSWWKVSSEKQFSSLIYAWMISFIRQYQFHYLKVCNEIRISKSTSNWYLYFSETFFQFLSQDWKTVIYNDVYVGIWKHRFDSFCKMSQIHHWFEFK